MTPQERKMIDELFDRLASLENIERDADAVDAINTGLDRAPNALYPLVQTVLVQDEALKRADTRIRELEGELGVTPERPPQNKTSFLEGMRDAPASKREPQGSVPSVQPAEASGGALAQPAGLKWGSGTTLSGVKYSSPPGGYSAAQEPGSPGGGSFLGTAAAAAAGVVGGALLMNSFRGMFGGGQQGQGNRAFDQGGGSPWNPGGAGGGDLARQAGVDDIGGRGNRTAAYDAGEGQRQGAFDVAQNDSQDTDDSGFDADDEFDDGFDSGGDSDNA
jgi:hypothetical protein